MADNNLIVPRFFMHTAINEMESKTQGRPIFDEIECVEIKYPGDRQKVSVFPAHEAEPNATRAAAENGGDVVTYAQLFNKQYREFKDDTVQTMSGTPLSELPFLTEGKRRELKALSIHTAEQLASLDGNPLKQLGMGGREMKNQAQAYLDNAAGSADVTALAAENESLRRQLAERDEIIAEVAKPRTNKKYQKEVRAAEKAQAKEEAAEAQAEQQGQSEQGAEEPEDEVSPFSSWDAADIKEWLKDATGEPVQGNPSHATLVKTADEVNERLTASEKQNS